jgi:hypothetical protein
VSAWLSAGTLFVLAPLFAAGGAASASDGILDRRSTPARHPALLMPGGKAERLEFDFGQVKGWLSRKGEWYFEGEIPHRGLLCGTYELGIRFGIGNPGCANVEWASEPYFVTRHLQCNNATVAHAGGDFDPGLAPIFDRVTCAERVVRCNGVCK